MVFNRRRYRDVSDLPCRFRGEEIPSCDGCLFPGVKVYECQIYQECSLNHSTSSIADCGVCGMREIPGAFVANGI